MGRPKMGFLVNENNWFFWSQSEIWFQLFLLAVKLDKLVHNYQLMGKSHPKGRLIKAMLQLNKDDQTVTLESNVRMPSNKKSKLFYSTKTLSCFYLVNNCSRELKTKWSIFCIKVVVKVTKVQISNGTISQNTCHLNYYWCGKFHSYMKKCMIFWLVPLYILYLWCL